VNASAPLLDREVEVQSKIGKVRTFGRIARVACAVIFGFGVVGSVGTLLVGVLGLILPGPISDSGFTPHQKMAALPMAGLMFGLFFAAVYQLYRLFGNLATGAIYTTENVRRLQRVGLLWLLLAVLGILIPFTWAVFVRVGLVEPSFPPKLDLWFSWPESATSFVAAGLILLISWVMDVGLYEKDHAEALQRDADLVI
jgi:Protein of unknown function (DUF2975)